MRIPGTAVFLNRGKTMTPLSLRANVEHNLVLHEHVIIMSVETEPVPRVGEGCVDVDTASYFVSNLEMTIGPEPTMAKWRKKLFITTSLITADAAAYFGLPRDRTIIIGSQIEV